MPNIIGEPLRSWVKSQITQRQLAHGSGVDKARSLDQISYLNSKTAWLKLASGVEVSENRLSKEELRNYNGDTLARHYVLFGGTSTLKETKLVPRGTDGLYPGENIWNVDHGTYNINASNDPSQFGLVPMPGLESAEIKCINRGSTKKATVKFKCYSPEQFKIIDLLYLRIGYTVLLEWGWSPYLNNSGKLISDYYTLIEDPNGFFNSKWKNSSYLSFLRSIERYRKAKNGNYDALLAKVVNFNWTVSQDGIYDIELSLISLGDVIESLKINVSPSYEMNSFLRQAYRLFNNEEDTDTNITPAPINNVISAYLFFQKLYLDSENNPDGGYTPDEYKNADNAQVFSTINGTKVSLGGVFIRPPKNGTIKLDKVFTFKEFETKSEAELWLDENVPDWKTYSTDPYSGTNSVQFQDNINEIEIFVNEYPEIETPGVTQEKKDVIYLNYNNGEDETINDAGFYMRFGHLLQFIKDYVIPRVKNSETSILDIDNGQWSNQMYIVPYQVSVDPRVCLVKGHELVSAKDFFPQLVSFKNLDKGYGWIMNIYLSHNQINKSLEDNVDDKGNIALFGFISDLCTAINKALGGVNNLEPIIDESENILRIIDGSYSKPKTDDYKIQLYGYESNQSNFVRNFSIKTEITNDFATMATVGSTAGGYVKGTENTMFSKWNRGLIDRFKEKLVPADKKVREKQEDGRDDPNSSYYNDFWKSLTSAFGYTLLDVEAWFTERTFDDTAALSDEIIDRNISIVTEFYKYCNAKLQETDEKYASPSSGFIPISLNLTTDGISGVKIYNEINVDTRFLPSNYPESLRFILKGINHKIDNNDWETTLETMVISNSENDPNSLIPSNSVNSVSNGSAPSSLASEVEENIGNSLTKEIPSEVKSETGCDLETFTKQSAQTIFKKHGSVKGLCGGYTYLIAEELARSLTGESKFPGTAKGGNDAHNQSLRNHLNDLTIYKPESLQPIGVDITKDDAIDAVNEITKKANYGDVLIYYVTPPPKYGKPNYRFHAQIYTGNLYSSGTGWSTSTKNNYGTSFVYSSAKGSPWTVYWFRIKDEYKCLSEGTSGGDPARAFNNLTYLLSLIYTLKDNYGKNKKPLFSPFKGVNDDEEKAVDALKEWFKTDKAQYQYKLLTGDYKKAFNESYQKLLWETKSSKASITFQYDKDSKVNKITINSDF